MAGQAQQFRCLCDGGVALLHRRLPYPRRHLLCSWRRLENLVTGKFPEYALAQIGAIFLRHQLELAERRRIQGEWRERALNPCLI